MRYCNCMCDNHISAGFLFYNIGIYVWGLRLVKGFVISDVPVLKCDYRQIIFKKLTLVNIKCRDL